VRGERAGGWRRRSRTGGPGLSAGRERGRGEPASWAAAQEEGEEGTRGEKDGPKQARKREGGKE